VLLQVAGKLAMIQGQPGDAIQFLNSVLDADPLRPTAHQLAEYAYLGAHRLKEAEAETRKALQISPDLDAGHYDLALILLAQGQRDAALREIEREVDGQNRDAGLAIVGFTMGRKSDSDAALARLLASSAKSWAGGISQVYAARGELDKAFAWLDRAYSQNDVDLPFEFAGVIGRELICAGFVRCAGPALLGWRTWVDRDLVSGAGPVRARIRKYARLRGDRWLVVQ
jgi:tetratricopeptide (TPR) repeat protein